MVTYVGWSDEKLEKRATSLARVLRRAWMSVVHAFVSLMHRQQTVVVVDAEQVTELWVKQRDAAVARVMDTFREAADDVLDVVGLERGVDRGRIDIGVIDAFIAQTHTHLVGVPDDIRRLVREQIQAGLIEGESTAQIALRIIDVADTPVSRALTIARTETHAAYEAGTLRQVMALGVIGTKRWLSMQDDRVRKTHRAASGQTVPIDEIFRVGDSQLLAPGVPAPSRNVDVGDLVNCRCSVVYDFDIIPAQTSDGDRRLR